MPEATSTLELAQRFRIAAEVAAEMPHYAEMMLRAAEDLEAFARERVAQQARIAIQLAA